MSKPFSVTFVPRKIAKFLVALVGVAGSALSLGLVPAAEKPWVTIAIGAASALGVYVTPNAAPADSAATQKSSM